MDPDEKERVALTCGEEETMHGGPSPILGVRCRRSDAVGCAEMLPPVQGLSFCSRFPHELHLSLFR